jgi:protein-S-isoprenylcysteine O-methyltransferase Ste14
MVMLNDVIVSLATLAILSAFFCVNLANFLRTRHRKRKQVLRSSIRASEGRGSNLAGFGSLLFWVEVFLFPSAVLFGFGLWFVDPPLKLTFPFDSLFQILGLLLSISGVLLFSWSILARGEYAVSWDMPKDHRLVTWGPYKYVRHPSYLAYFLLISGFFLTWLNLLILPCFGAIPGYLLSVETEEKMLVERFGDEYRLYQKRTSKFIPRMKKQQNQE